MTTETTTSGTKPYILIAFDLDVQRKIDEFYYAHFRISLEELTEEKRKAWNEFGNHPEFECLFSIRFIQWVHTMDHVVPLAIALYEHFHTNIRSLCIGTSGCLTFEAHECDWRLIGDFACDFCITHKILPPPEMVANRKIDETKRDPLVDKACDEIRTFQINSLKDPQQQQPTATSFPPVKREKEKKQKKKADKKPAALPACYEAFMRKPFELFSAGDELFRGGVREAYKELLHLSKQDLKKYILSNQLVAPLKEPTRYIVDISMNGMVETLNFCILLVDKFKVAALQYDGLNNRLLFVGEKEELKPMREFLDKEYWPELEKWYAAKGHDSVETWKFKIKHDDPIVFESLFDPNRPQP